MAKKEPTKLRTLLRETYSELKRAGRDRLTIHELIEHVTLNHPKLVEQEKDRLFRDAIGAWTRQILKSSSASLRSSQLILPLDLGPLPLPVCVPVWPKGRKRGEADWIELADITFDQLEIEISRKRKSLLTNKEYRNLVRLREYLAPHMGRRRHKPIGPVLAQLAKEQRKPG